LRNAESQKQAAHFQFGIDVRREPPGKFQDQLATPLVF
jgi:hypothetical protein